MGKNIVNDSKPAVAAGKGPFLRQDTGKGGGFCAYPPDAGAGEIGLPSDTKETVARAIEAHEYMHLATGQYIPQLRDLNAAVLRLGVKNSAVQAVLDDFVHCIGAHQDVIRERLAGLTFGDKPLPEIILEASDSERLLMKLRAEAVPALRKALREALDTVWYEERTKAEREVATGEHSSDVDVAERVITTLGEIDLRQTSLNSSAGTIHRSVEIAATIARDAPHAGSGIPSGMTLDTYLDRMLETFDCTPEQAIALKRAVVLPGYRHTREEKISMLAAAHLFNAMRIASEAIDAIDRYHEEKAKETSPGTVHAGDKIVDIEDLHDRGTADVTAAELHKEALEVSMGGHGKFHSEGFTEGFWGEMTIQEMDMVETIKATVARRRVRYGFDGPFRYPHRIPPAGDGTCFGHKRKVRGGTLLIDMSGSMGLTATDIREIITMLPAAMIAGYGSKGGKKGMLIVLAREGRMVDLDQAREVIGEANIVDGPALRWLTGQKGPRIWVSDGQVTGWSDMLYDNLTREAMQQVLRGKIIWLANIGNAKDYVTLHPGMFLS